MLDEFKVNLAYRTISAPIAGLTTDLLYDSTKAYFEFTRAFRAAF